MKKTLTLVLVLLTLTACTTKNKPTTKDKPREEQVVINPNTSTMTTPDTTKSDRPQLKIEILKEGTGKGADTGDVLQMFYTGTLTDGTQFDSNIGRSPFTFTLGQGQVIQGWDVGIMSMKVGGKRRLTIPPEMAYGKNGVGPIPPNSTLNFEIELVGIKK